MTNQSCSRLTALRQQRYNIFRDYQTTPILRALWYGSCTRSIMCSHTDTINTLNIWQSAFAQFTLMYSLLKRTPCLSRPLH